MAEAFGRRRRKFQRLGSFTPKKSNNTTEKSKKKKKRKKKNLHNNRTKPEASPVSPVSSEPRPSQPPTTTTCRTLKTSMSRSYGEIVEVEGGHIVRSTGRKDRHSKVCTAKGPRDRRVRLSAHTAIQFYDVQDRLGYDRPSKAVDWLINNAKAAIDQLHQPPPPSLDSDAIKSFFPVVSGEQQSQSQSQDLRLSLQSLQDPIFHQQQQQSFGWSDHHNNNSQSFVFGSPQTAEYGRENSQLLFSSSSSQRGPLQSSNTPNWIDSHHHQSLSMADHHIPHPIHHEVAASSSSSMPAGIGIGVGFAAGAFSSGAGGFHHHFPARFQGEEEHHGGADNPSSASSDSRH